MHTSSPSPPASCFFDRFYLEGPDPFSGLLSGKPDAKAQAAKAAKAVKKGSFKRTRKPRFSVVFHRPKTLKRTRDPKYTRVR